MGRSASVAVIGTGVARELKSEGHRVESAARGFTHEMSSMAASTELYAPTFPGSSWDSSTSLFQSDKMGTPEPSSPTSPVTLDSLGWFGSTRRSFGSGELARGMASCLLSRTRGSDSVREVFAAVVVCTLNFVEPQIPVLVGIEKWPGYQIHIPEKFRVQIDHVFEDGRVAFQDGYSVLIMTELVAGALLSASLQVLFQRLSEEIPRLFQGKKVILDQLQELRIVLWSANVLLNDAEEKQLRITEIKMWLSELQDLIYHADDLVDMIDYKAQRSKLKDDQSSSSANKVLKKFMSPFLSKFDRTVKLDSREILRKLKILVDQKDALGLRDGAQKKPSPRPPAPLVEHDDVYGRDADKKIIVDLLLKDDAGSGNNISVIPIVGMGGLGKTTLAQVVYDDERVRKYFELKVWVTVSDEFDICKITKEIYEGVTGTKCDIQNFEELRRRLKEALMGKKFLFVHDDVWNESYGQWNTLKSSFESGANGSKILVTTRSTIVASTMATNQVHHLQTLLTGDCWKLFGKHAFGNNFDQNSYKDLQEHGRKIVEKCKGLPLAIKSLGGLLRWERNPKRWEDILCSDTWEELFKKEQSILPALWLSYRHLPTHLKPCFAFCSIFPKDYEFEREKLILLWMAEGFLPTDSKSKNMEEFGKEYFKDLLSRSFFQSSRKNESLFHMHDLVHDLAMLVSNDFCFRLDLSNDVLNLSTKIRHVLCKKGISNQVDFNKLNCLREANYLRTFISLGMYIPNNLVVFDILLTKGCCLRVLSLSYSCMQEVPDSIANLKHLRYLDLSGAEIEELPDSICRLYNLQTLLLSRCEKLSQLPKNMGKLVNLRYLDVKGVPLKGMPSSIGNLEYLRHLDLSHTKIKELPDSICSLYNLQTLLLSWCTKLSQLPKNMGRMINLRYLDIECVPLKEMPQGISQMKCLQLLSPRVVLSDKHKDDGFKITELAKLKHLSGKLHISGLENVNDSTEASKANLKDKKDVIELSLSWSCGENDDADDSKKELDVLDALRPHTNLKRLEINSYRGTIFSNWIGDYAFFNLVSISLRDCKSCFSLPPFGKLVSLKELKIDGCDSVCSIVDEIDSSGRLFTCLESLSIRNMLMWKEWSFGSEVNVQEAQIFPLLKELELRNCPKLNVGLPDCHSSLQSLKTRDLLLRTQQTVIAPPSLEAVCIENCAVLESRLDWGPYSKVKQLHLYNTKVLFDDRMKWDLQKLSCLEDLNINGWEDGSFPDEGLLPITLRFIWIKDSSTLETLNGKAFQQLTSLTTLFIENCENLQYLPEDGLPTSLTWLSIYKCPLLNQRCEKGGEDWPKIQHIKTVTLDYKLIN